MNFMVICFLAKLTVLMTDVKLIFLSSLYNNYIKNQVQRGEIYENYESDDDKQLYS